MLKWSKGGGYGARQFGREGSLIVAGGRRTAAVGAFKPSVRAQRLLDQCDRDLHLRVVQIG